MRLLELEFGGILDRHDPLPIVNEGGHRVQQGRLARARSAGDQHVAPRANDRLEDGRHLLGERSQLDQPGHADGIAREFADGHQRTVDREGRDDGVDATAVRQACIDHGLGFIDPSTHGGDDLVDDPHQVARVLEPHVRQFELPQAFDIDRRMGVDQDVVDRVVGEQGLERPKAQEFVQNIVDQDVGLRRRQQAFFLGQQARDHAVHLIAQLFARRALQGAEVQQIQQLLVDADPQADTVRCRGARGSFAFPSGRGRRAGVFRGPQHALWLRLLS
ncbi:hypothetical protein D3C80_703870 [compost metagenome]